MKRREVEIFMAVKEAGDFVINSMKRGKTVRVNNESIAYDINKKFSTSSPVKAEQIKQMIERYLYNNCMEYREYGMCLNSDFEHKEYILKDYIAKSVNPIIDSLKNDKNKKLRLITIYQQIIEELNADVAPNKLDLTAEELERMVNNYIEKNCDNIKIVHETIDVESHAVVYRVA